MIRRLWRETYGEPHTVVRVVTTGHAFLRKFFAYEWGLRAWRAARPNDVVWAAAFAPLYIFSFWLPVLIILFSTRVSGPGHGALRVFVVLALYRIADIANFYVGLFFDRRQTLLAGFERSLMCLIGNFVEVIVALAVVLESTAGEHQAAAWRDALSIMTFVALPARSGTWSLPIETVGSFVALLLLSGGLAMLIQGISSKFHSGPYVGPRP